jgi:hypothetical protein
MAARSGSRPAITAELGFLANRMQLAIGTFVLLLGVVLYLFGRPPDRTWLFTLLPPWLSGYGVVPRLPTWLNGSLPTFLHACSLTLVTGALLDPRIWAYVCVSFSWLLIHVMFELGQGPGQQLVELAPIWIDRIPLASHVRGYFVLGTFDKADVIAALFGCVCGFGTLTLTRNRKAHIP